jgi:hypothetical protein
MVFNATFNNISVISLQSVLLVEEIGVHRENHRPAASNWHNVVLSTPRHERDLNSQRWWYWLQIVNPSAIWSPSVQYNHTLCFYFSNFACMNQNSDQKIKFCSAKRGFDFVCLNVTVHYWINFCVRNRQVFSLYRLN